MCSVCVQCGVCSVVCGVCSVLCVCTCVVCVAVLCVCACATPCACKLGRGHVACSWDNVLYVLCGVWMCGVCLHWTYVAGAAVWMS